MNRKMEYRTKNEFAYTSMRDALVSGTLQPGDWIRSEDWAEELGLSQTPVREALRRLEAQGLVEIYPHRGARVTARTRDHLVETFLIRCALESLAARLALERTSDAEYKDLFENVEQLTSSMADAVKAADHDLVRALNREIHMSIYRAAGLPRLLDMIDSLWATYPFDTLSMFKGRPEQALLEHRNILDAIRSRDPAAMASAMESHLEAPQRLLTETEHLASAAS